MFQSTESPPSFPPAACESEISAAVTETKAAQMRLASAQSELKEKEGLCKDSGHSYTQDKAKFDALGKEIAKIEVRTCMWTVHLPLYQCLNSFPLKQMLHN